MCFFYASLLIDTAFLRLPSVNGPFVKYDQAHWIIFLQLCTHSFYFHSGDGSTLPRVQCPNHPDAILVEDYRAGDMICPECGLVVGKHNRTSQHVNFTVTNVQWSQITGLFPHDSICPSPCRCYSSKYLRNRYELQHRRPFEGLTINCNLAVTYCYSPFVTYTTQSVMQPPG